MIFHLYKAIKGLLPLAIVTIIGSEFYCVETVTIVVISPVESLIKGLSTESVDSLHINFMAMTPGHLMQNMIRLLLKTMKISIDL